MSTCLLPVSLVATVLAAGCAGRGGVNSSFDVSAPRARVAMRDMAHDPKPLAHPVVVLDGLGPPLASAHLASVLRRTTGDDRIVPVHFVFCFSLEDCRRRVLGQHRHERAIGGADEPERKGENRTLKR